MKKRFLKYKDRVKTGPGKIDENIKLARKQRVKKYR